MNCMDGCACAPVTSKGKGNHCKSYSVPPVHPFDKTGKNTVFFPFSSAFRLCPLCVQSASSHRLAGVHLSFSPSTDIHSKQLCSVSTGIKTNDCADLKRNIAQAFCTSGDLEMKTDFTFFCRTWIGIAFASGEETFPVSMKVLSAQLF